MGEKREEEKYSNHRQNSVHYKRTKELVWDRTNWRCHWYQGPTNQLMMMMMMQYIIKIYFYFCLNTIKNLEEY